MDEWATGTSMRERLRYLDDTLQRWTQAGKQQTAGIGLSESPSECSESQRTKATGWAKAAVPASDPGERRATWCPLPYPPARPKKWWNESASASQLASITFSLTPTVPQTASPSVLSIDTRTLAAVPSWALITRTL